jgi:hypothetical protein
MGLDAGGSRWPGLLWVKAGEGLAEPAAEVADVLDEPTPGGAVGVEVLVVGSVSEFAEGLVGCVEQPVFEDGDVVEEFAQVIGLVFGEGGGLALHGGLRFRAGRDGRAALCCTAGLPGGLGGI